MKILILILSIALYSTNITTAYDEDEEFLAEMEITDLELQDDCENLANSLKFAILNNNFTQIVSYYTTKLLKKKLSKIGFLDRKRNCTWRFIEKTIRKFPIVQRHRFVTNGKTMGHRSLSR